MSWLYSTNLELNSTQIADCMSHNGISDVLIAIEININGIIIYNNVKSIRYKKWLQILCVGDTDKNWYVYSVTIVFHSLFHNFIIKYDQGNEHLIVKNIRTSVTCLKIFMNST